MLDKEVRESEKSRPMHLELYVDTRDSGKKGSSYVHVMNLTYPQNTTVFLLRFCIAPNAVPLTSKPLVHLPFHSRISLTRRTLEFSSYSHLNRFLRSLLTSLSSFISLTYTIDERSLRPVNQREQVTSSSSLLPTPVEAQLMHNLLFVASSSLPSSTDRWQLPLFPPPLRPLRLPVLLSAARLLPGGVSRLQPYQTSHSVQPCFGGSNSYCCACRDSTTDGPKQGASSAPRELA